MTNNKNSEPNLQNTIPYFFEIKCKSCRITTARYKNVREMRKFIKKSLCMKCENK